MLHGQQINSKFIGAVFASVLLLANLAAAEPQHGIAMYGDPALPHDFVSLPYANPNAPKGGNHCVRRRRHLHFTQSACPQGLGALAASIFGLREFDGPVL